MFYVWFLPLQQLHDAAGNLRYVSCRAALAALTAFVTALLIGRKLIPFLRDWYMEAHLGKDFARFRVLKKESAGKQHTPSMGGLIMLVAFFLSCIVWVDLHNNYVQCVLFAMVSLAVVGFVDDWVKLTDPKRDGIPARAKLACQVAVGLVIGLMLYFDNYIPESTTVRSVLYFPYARLTLLSIGPLYVLWCAFVVSGTSNATNLTDGLDGLAIGCTVIVTLVLGALSYAVGSPEVSRRLSMPYVPHSGELAVLCAVLAGAGLGFLSFNAYPAKVFMGDTGSLSLGGGLAVIALTLRHESILPLVGAVFVLEALSVIIQIVCFKTTGWRPFAVAPFHHHIQKRWKWHETQITTRFWTLTLMAAIFGLAFLGL